MSDKKQKEILKIEGMTCANCALGIKKHLDKNGVCNACRKYENLHMIDWDKREKELV